MIENGEIETLHVPFRKWLDDNGLLYRYSTPGRRTSENASDSDFWIVKNGRLLMIEFKRPKKGILSDAQIERFADLGQQGCMVHVVKELGIACDIVTAWLSQDNDQIPVNHPAHKPTVLWKGASLRERPDGSFDRVTP